MFGIPQVNPEPGGAPAKVGNSERTAAVELFRQSDARDWEPETVARYLSDLLEEHGDAARVSTQDDARLLNDVLLAYAKGPGHAACEACRCVFSVERRRARMCRACVREAANELTPSRRRSGRAWWLDDPIERCLGLDCDAPVALGNLYCSDRCRVQVRRYLDRGGSIEAPRAGYPGGIIRPR